MDPHYVLTSKPVLRATSTVFEPKQVQYTVNQETFPGQEAVF